MTFWVKICAEAGFETFLEVQSSLGTMPRVEMRFSYRRKFPVEVKFPLRVAQNVLKFEFVRCY